MTTISYPNESTNLEKRGLWMSRGGTIKRLGVAMHAPKTHIHSIRAMHNTRRTKKNERLSNYRDDEFGAL